MTDVRRSRTALVERILGGDGRASRAQRRAAFDRGALDEPLRRLVDKVAESAHTVTEEDIAAVRAAGLSEDEVFEVVVCSAIGQASRQYDAALTALLVAEEK